MAKVLVIDDEANLRKVLAALLRRDGYDVTIAHRKPGHDWGRRVHEIIADRNCGVGLVVAANHVAIGLILYGVISGEGGGPVALLVFWALGQASLILAACGPTAINSPATPPIATPVVIVQPTTAAALSERSDYHPYSAENGWPVRVENLPKFPE